MTGVTAVRIVHEAVPRIAAAVAARDRARGTDTDPRRPRRPSAVRAELRGAEAPRDGGPRVRVGKGLRQMQHEPPDTGDDLHADLDEPFAEGRDLRAGVERCARPASGVLGSST